MGGTGLEPVTLSLSSRNAYQLRKLVVSFPIAPAGAADNVAVVVGVAECLRSERLSQGRYFAAASIPLAGFAACSADSLISSVRNRTSSWRYARPR